MPRRKLKQILEADDLENVFCEKWRDLRSLIDGREVVLELGCGKGHYTIALAQREMKGRGQSRAYRDDLQSGDNDRGELSEAQTSRQKIFFGIDLKGSRIFKAAKRANELKLDNAFFIRDYAENLGQYFNKGEVAEIWITFPDPFEKPSKANKRLFSPKYLDLYFRLLKAGGRVYLKTDNENLFDYAKKLVGEGNGADWEVEKVIEDLHGGGKVCDGKACEGGVGTGEVCDGKAVGGEQFGLEVSGKDEDVEDNLKITTYYERKFLNEGKKIKYLQLKKRR